MPQSEDLASEARPRIGGGMLSGGKTGEESSSLTAFKWTLRAGLAEEALSEGEEEPKE